uniref:Uncharacterized protein n=1 Tax=Arundo donax TaxID=35708 RepID=A0A0A8ZBE4_ARUDO
MNLPQSADNFSCVCSWISHHSWFCHSLKK